MSVRFQAVTAGTGTVYPILAKTDASLSPSLPISISLWFRVENTQTTRQILWWYGENGTENHLFLQFNNTTQKLELVAGSGYAGISQLVSTDTFSRNEWHLVTVVISYSGGALSHVMYVDEEVYGISQTLGSAPPVGDWDRVTIGSRDATPIRPLDGYIEQLAIWTSTALSQSDHDTMWSDSTFNGLRREPDALTSLPNVVWWNLFGRRRAS